MANAPLPNTNVPVLGPDGQFTLPWRRWFQALSGVSGATGPEGPSGPEGPEGPPGSSAGGDVLSALALGNLNSGVLSLSAGPGILLTPDPISRYGIIAAGASGGGGGGDDGEDGAPGPPGGPGPAGAAGAAGAVGPQGPIGFSMDGEDGADGMAIPGSPGPQGPAGTPTKPVLRGSNITSSSAASYTISFPAGTVAGDLAVLMVGGGFGVSAVVTTTSSSLWVILDTKTGADWNGAAAYRYLNAADISGGSVVVTMAGTFNTVLSMATFAGATGGPRIPVLPAFITQQTGLSSIVSSQNATGASTRTLNSMGDILTTDYVLYFGSNRNSSTDTISLGSALQTVTAAAGSGVLTGGSPGATGGVSPVYSYSVTSGTTGDYQVIIPIKGS